MAPVNEKIRGQLLHFIQCVLALSVQGAVGIGRIANGRIRRYGEVIL
jgi:hypothetical protein